MYDLIIIGGGPAATAGAVYAARKQLKTLLVAKEFGGQSTVSQQIRNWIGTKSISGLDLGKQFKEHVEDYKGEYLEIKEGILVNKVEKTGEGFRIILSDESTIPTRTVLVASGGSRRKLDVPGAAEFENKGVVYCASCDGPLFSGKEVAVIGGGNAGFETAAQLLAYCPKVTLIHRRDEFRADEITVKKVLSHPNMHTLTDTVPTGVQGDNFVTDLTYRNLKTSEEGTLPVGGIFVEIGQIPNTGFVKDIVDMDQFNRVKVDPKTQQSSQGGIWAAGDCTDGLYHQNNIAAGDAVKAIENLYLYLHTQK